MGVPSRATAPPHGAGVEGAGGAGALSRSAPGHHRDRFRNCRWSCRERWADAGLQLHRRLHRAPSRSDHRRDVRQRDAGAGTPHPDVDHQVIYRNSGGEPRRPRRSRCRGPRHGPAAGAARHRLRWRDRAAPARHASGPRLLGGLPGSAERLRLPRRCRRMASAGTPRRSPHPARLPPDGTPRSASRRRFPLRVGQLDRARMGARGGNRRTICRPAFPSSVATDGGGVRRICRARPPGHVADRRRPQRDVARSRSLRRAAPETRGAQRSPGRSCLVD